MKKRIVQLLLSITIFTSLIINIFGREDDSMLLVGNEGIVKSFFIKAENGYIMVDTGFKDSSVQKALKKHNIAPGEITHLIISHGHQDHYGGAAFLKEISGAKIIAHREAVSVLKKGGTEPLITHTFWGGVINAIIPEYDVAAVTPDIIVDDEYDLNQIGCRGKIIHTPGHTDGSLSIILESGEVLVGDLIRGKRDKVSYGIWYVDKDEINRSLRKILSYHPSKIVFSHGKSISAVELKRFLNE